MNTNNMDTLSKVIDALNNEGFVDDFKAGENCIKALYSKREYRPEDLKIAKSFRFDGFTNPDDESELFAIKYLRL